MDVGPSRVSVVLPSLGLLTPSSSNWCTSSRKEPFTSGMNVASIASDFTPCFPAAMAASPIPARSATTRRRSKFMLAPLATAHTFNCRLSSVDEEEAACCCLSHFFAPATASAPEGSVMERVSSKISLMAAQISSVSTSTISSTTSWQIRNGSTPTIFTATPSAKVSTLSRRTLCPAIKLSCMAHAPNGSTPMILMSGRTRFRYAPTPEMRPPPPTGRKTASSSALGAWRRSSRPMVPWPAMTSGSSKGGM
mmetsp:Transcript_384/g.733  ORF Transcript_384/g.733 Transcript_384/m.733 type:complete len:251 (+) Transcript_384:645-1397(+)